MVADGLVADEVERLVLLDRPADGPAELVVALLRLVAGVQRRVVEPHRPGFQMLVREIFEARSVHAFDPLRVCTLIAAPPASPCSASMLLVTMLTS